jgi:hypothetical protein
MAKANFVIFPGNCKVLRFWPNTWSVVDMPTTLWQGTIPRSAKGTKIARLPHPRHPPAALPFCLSYNAGSQPGQHKTVNTTSVVITMIAQDHATKANVNPYLEFQAGVTATLRSWSALSTGKILGPHAFYLVITSTVHTCITNTHPYLRSRTT